MFDVVIVGGGLFGQVIAKAMEDQGREVVILDAKMEGAGSKPAACLMKPSWFSGMGREVYEPSLELLDQLYGVQDLQFALRPLKNSGKIATGTVHWIQPSKILTGSEPTEATVVGITAPTVHYTIPGDSQVHKIQGREIIVAAGVWTQRLLHQYPQTAQKGVAFLFPDTKIKEPFIRPWAPYRQLVAFNRGDGVWASDGTAIKEENWTEEREIKACHRVMDHLEDLHMPLPPVMLTGLRPYAKGHKPCLLEEVQPGLWVASGGAKNGTLAAGWCAHEIARRTS